ncbi:Putative uncharacterized protein OS=Rhodopirellula baltica (strain SH1) GN=RB11207 PE=4 SV=1: SNARE_assoc: DUF547 [Gemmataceae bacterium]|nr:Putative uncharacterized protein OS=Rhodopirellula baltica (strain SH1) GN=RB11207 PE=4 SV=1: SNARE_assoc: DUF547 [Gemmataceae bacterium]VTT99550.1 Putative uncharacterized protein OS=Rhodopirellula baltica (strain SH1) GN=RB11207 PE=4 SV=1: SNARE_assoc: DUF547 [Gemmataceae bacterium]
MRHEMEAATEPVPTRGPSAFANRYATLTKWVSVALVALSVLLILRRLPLGPVMQALEEWIASLSTWGPVVFVVLYVIAVVFVFPASPLTLAAGALFGLAGGLAVASVGSTTGAALAFLVARYLARDRVAKWVERYPKFAAIDRAVGAGGWRIVAMLRLSPAVPFNLQNYLYGLTRIRFWPCVLTSWAAMLPGTFLYVYLGHVGRAGLDASAGAERARTPAEWALMAVGLLATVFVTVYVTRLARRALKQYGDIEKPNVQGTAPVTGEAARPKGWPWGTTALATFALVTVGVAVAVHFNPSLISLGPPEVVLREAYEEKSDGPAFDHSAIDELMKAHVDRDGWVDYEGLKRDAAKLDAYIAAVASAPFDEMGRSQKLAMLLNAYNAFTVRLILDYYPIASIQDIPAPKRWDDVRWQVGPHRWSLNQIEHEQIRPKFREPRIHFALVCAAVGCPKLRNEAYRPNRLEEQLEDQTRYVHGHGRWFRVEPGAGAVHLTRLYLWYGGDFRQVAGSVPKFAARYAPDLNRALEAGSTPKIEWLPYDWALNSQNNKR